MAECDELYGSESIKCQAAAYYGCSSDDDNYNLCLAENYYTDCKTQFIEELEEECSNESESNTSDTARCSFLSDDSNYEQAFDDLLNDTSSDTYLTTSGIVQMLSFTSECIEGKASSSTSSLTQSAVISEGISDYYQNEGAADAGEDRTSLERSICLLIMIFTGRIARAIAGFAIIALAFKLYLGKLDWPSLLIFAVGVSFVFGAGQIALMIMPKSVSILDDTEESGTLDKSTAEIIQEACPNAL
jgi:type IV secretory pathway VirB2 component (pilin)